MLQAFLFYHLPDLAKRSKEKRRKSYRDFSLISPGFPPPLEVLCKRTNEVQEEAGFLPPKQFIQLIFFKFKISRLAVCCAVGYAAVKQVINQNFHFFFG